MKKNLKAVLKKMLGKKPALPNTYCPVCNTKGVTFLPLAAGFLKKWHIYGFVYNIFRTETLNINDYTCSNCNTADRDRLYALYLSDFFNKHSSQTIKLLDVAPAPQLQRFIKGYANVNYRSTDLYMAGVDDVQDLTNMTLYTDNMFDFEICSHVLEHIPDDVKAMQEMHRVLKPGGQAIMMVPINLDVVETHENFVETDPAYRWKYFGQDDHVRMYAKKDFIARLTEAGFKVNQLGVDHFTKEVFDKCGIFNSSILYIVTK